MLSETSQARLEHNRKESGQKPCTVEKWNGGKYFVGEILVLVLKQTTLRTSVG